MSATVVSLQSNNITETVDFLRRLASMMAGGRNAELLLQAAAMIDAQTRRALTAEELFRQQQDETEKILALRDVAEMATDNLMAEVDALKAQVADAASRAETERARFAEEACRLRALADDAEARYSKVQTELAEQRDAFDALGASTVMVPMDTLRLALAQFDHLADSFARSGDIISQTICDIGTCTIEQAIAGGRPAKSAQ